MTDVGYVAAGYAITAAVLVAYAARLLHRVRAVRRYLPPEERRWASGPTATGGLAGPPVERP